MTEERAAFMSVVWNLAERVGCGLRVWKDSSDRPALGCSTGLGWRLFLVLGGRLHSTPILRRHARLVLLGLLLDRGTTHPIKGEPHHGCN
jgi:hypothetical protein